MVENKSGHRRNRRSKGRYESERRKSELEGGNQTCGYNEAGEKGQERKRKRNRKTNVNCFSALTFPL